MTIWLFISGEKERTCFVISKELLPERKSLLGNIPTRRWKRSWPQKRDASLYNKYLEGKKKGNYWVEARRKPPFLRGEVSDRFSSNSYRP